MTEPVDPRLQRLLGGEGLAGLRQRLRQRFERVPAGEALTSVRLGALSEAENAALAALLGRPARGGGSMQVDIAQIDVALQRAGIAASLGDALERLDGPLLNASVERERVAASWQVVLGGCTHPGLAAWLGTADAVGLLRRLSTRQPATAEGLLASTQAVLEHLPAPGLTRAQLAARVLGDAHALDGGQPVATLVLAALRHATVLREGGDAQAAATAADTTTATARELWASAGVLVNELARPALCLNLPHDVPSDGETAMQRGEPAYLSLRRLLRSPPHWAVAGRTIYVCENPNLLAIAADRLGARCAPLVCTDGMPAAAQRTLLTQLTQASAVLHYHGDFDWPGLHIGNHLVRAHSARPWRFGCADYARSVALAPRPGRVLSGSPVQAAWDERLTEAMLHENLSVDEEAVAESLLDDLAP